MIEVKSKLDNLRISPRKVRLVASLIRGLDAIQAKTVLQFSVKNVAKPILKCLNSAIANAEHNFGINKNNLFISKITVDGGRSLKRQMPRAMGRAFLILKRTSKVLIVLEEKEGQVVSGKTEAVKDIAKSKTAEKVSGKIDKKSEYKKRHPENIKKIAQPAIKKKIFQRKAI